MALSILREMKEKGIEPNEVTYGVAVAACGNGGQWEKSLELLDQVRTTSFYVFVCRNSIICVAPN